MKAIKADLSNELKIVELHTFSDWHIGDLACNKKNIQAEIDAILANPNAFVICNGDLLNNATKTSVSDCYSEELAPMDAIKLLTDLLEPIKDKILMITQGNHEARTYRTDGIDLTYLVAKQLGIDDKYCREGGVLFIRFGHNKALGTKEKPRKQIYTIYATHGSGGGRKEGAKAVRLADMAAIVDTDIYIHSHTHLPMVMKQSFFRVSGSNSSVAQCEKLFVNTSAQLGYGGYGQTFEFKPSSNANPVIYLNGIKKEFTARL